MTERRRGGRPLAVGAAILAVAFAAACSSDSESSGGEARSTEPTSSGPRLIIDTDLSLWWDDASTIGIANVLDQQGEIELLGIMSNVPNAEAVAAIDAINTAYGNADVPLGAVTGSEADTFEDGYTDELVEQLPHSVDDHEDVPDAVALYRRLLAEQPDRSVTIVSIGGYTNLAGLLASGPGEGSRLDGRDLIEQKVARLVQMDGIFPGGGPAFTNQQLDLEAANTVVAGDWPTPIAWVDGLGGIETKVGGLVCTAVPNDHPTRVVYETLFACGPPGDGNWDAPTLLYAIDDLDGVFSEEGQGGAAVINADGGLSWQAPSSRPDDVYVHVVDQQTLNQRIDELLVE
jgi:hypothetical protein